MFGDEKRLLNERGKKDKAIDMCAEILLNYNIRLNLISMKYFF